MIHEIDPPWRYTVKIEQPLTNTLGPYKGPMGGSFSRVLADEATQRRQFEKYKSERIAEAELALQKAKSLNFYFIS